MKLKILITPIVFVLVVILSIWYIKPTFDEWNAAKINLESKQTFFDSLKVKNEKVAKWKTLVAGNTEKKDIITKYVPKEAKEEDIMDNLNSMAMDAGVVISDVTLVAPKTLAIQPEPVAALVVDPALIPPPVDEAVVDSKLDASAITVTLNAFGSYDKLKNFFGKTASFRRFNEISLLKISIDDAATSGSADDSSEIATLSSDLLTAEVSFTFNYAQNGGDLIASINDAVFNAETLDMSVAKSITDTKSIVAKDLSVGQSGHTNPFIK